MYIVYMAGRPPRQKAKNDARQQLWCAQEQAASNATSVAVVAESSLRSPRKLFIFIKVSKKIVIEF